MRVCWECPDRLDLTLGSASMVLPADPCLDPWHVMSRLPFGQGERRGGGGGGEDILSGLGNF